MSRLAGTALISVLVLCIFSCNKLEKQNITKINIATGQGSELPNLFLDNSGSLFLNWVEPASEEGEFRLFYSKMVDTEWTTPSEVSRSDSWFVNWADYPSLVAYSGEPVAAHTLRKVPGNTYSYNVNILLKGSAGSWSEPIVPHFDSTATEHGFVSMIPISSKELMVAWLDGRRTHGRADDEYFNLDKAMTLRSAILNTDGSMSNKLLIDPSVCDCCQTSMTLTQAGPFLAYRNRTGEEIRDIYYTRYANGSWTEPVAIHDDQWKIGACPVNGPRVASRDSTVAIAWYTEAGNKPTVKTAISTDLGQTFGAPIIIEEGNTVGRVDISIADDGTVYVSEISFHDENYYLTLHEVVDNSKSTTSFRITEISQSRSSGFPQMEYIDNQLIFAWTEVTGDTLNKVNSARLAL